ncbi:MAG: hypothetical protein IJO81_02795 [Clostridia bacterium]|nr:hypothetical protein [Clostridia bacterium]
MDKNEMKKAPFQGMDEAVSAAICVSSVSLFGAWVTVLLALAVTVGILAGAGVRFALGKSTAAKVSAALLSSSAALAAANAASAYVGLDTFPGGVFSACAVAVTFILCRAGDEKPFRRTATAVLVYSTAVTAAGVVAEVLGSGQLFGARLPWNDVVVGVFSTPAGGMILCAVIAAVCKYIMKKGEAGISECKR